jgi:hypothetical protein
MYLYSGIWWWSWLFFLLVGVAFGIWHCAALNRERWGRLVESLRRELPEAMRRLLPPASEIRFPSPEDLDP